jgi:hypothetical protein
MARDSRSFSQISRQSSLASSATRPVLHKIWSNSPRTSRGLDSLLSLFFRNDRGSFADPPCGGCARFTTLKQERLATKSTTPLPKFAPYPVCCGTWDAAKTEIEMEERDEIVWICKYHAGVRSVAQHSRMHARACASIRSVRPCETGWHRLHGRGACHMVRGTPRSRWWLSKIPLSILQGRAVGAGG